MPYLIVRGALKFMAFTESVFGAKEISANRAMRGPQTVMHAEIRIGDSTIMFADSTDEFAPRSAALFVYVEDADLTYKAALSKAAKSIREPSDQPYGRSAGVEDSFGNQWWITSVSGKA